MLTLTTAYEAQLTHEWAQRGGWDRSCRAPLPSAHPPNNATLLCSLELQKPYVIGCFFSCFLPPALPTSQCFGVPDWMLFQQPTSKLQWSHIQGAGPYLPGSSLSYHHASAYVTLQETGPQL